MPVFSSHVVDYAGLGVGRRIREERTRHHLTLRQLAERIGVSQATLSNIETEKVAIDLVELGRVADALELPLATFLPRSRTSHHLIRRANEVEQGAPVMRKLVGPEPGPPVHHNPIWPLADLFVGKHMEPVLAEIRPLADKDLHFIAHDHEEFMFVLRGEVETQLKTNEGVVREQLRPGDCMYFRSNLPHCHRSMSQQPATTINVIYSMRGPIDPHDGELESYGRRFYRRGVYADAAREAGEKMGLLRRSHGVTLAELGHDLGMGIRRLADVERGDRAPDLDMLVRLAKRFRRPIEYFFSTTLESQPFYFVQRAAEISALPVHSRKDGRDAARRDNGNTFRPLALGFPDRGLHPYYVRLSAETSSAPERHEHHGQEFIYVLDGEVEFRTADTGNVELLRPGDSIFLDSSVPHSVRGHSRNPFAAAGAEILDVFWTPLGMDYLFQV